MSVTITLELTTKTDDGGEAVVAMFAERLPHTRTFDGCESIDLFVDQSNPRHLIVIQEWESGDKYTAYSDWAMSQPGTQELLSHVEGSLTIGRWGKIPT